MKLLQYFLFYANLNHTLSYFVLVFLLGFAIQLDISDKIKYFVQKPAEKPEEVNKEKRIVSEVKNEGK